MPDVSDALAQAKAERLAVLVTQLIPGIRALSTHRSEHEVCVAANRMAGYRLDDAESGRTSA